MKYCLKMADFLCVRNLCSKIKMYLKSVCLCDCDTPLSPLSIHSLGCFNVGVCDKGSNRREPFGVVACRRMGDVDSDEQGPENSSVFVHCNVMFKLGRHGRSRSQPAKIVLMNS